MLPLDPGEKGPPPSGFTGYQGQDPSDDEIASWLRARPCANVALRYPDGVLGLDVDDYGGKHGGRTLAEHEERLGSLPPTWTITSREGSSGTRLYAVERGRLWVSGLAGGGVDVIQRAHRYSVVPPSRHPDGPVYRLVGPDGSTTDGWPAPGDLPQLPGNWQQNCIRRRRREARLSRRLRPDAGAAGPLQVDSTLVLIAQQAISSGQAKVIRDRRRVTVQGLAEHLGVSRSRAAHLEAGKLGSARSGLLERYGAWLRDGS